MKKLNGIVLTNVNVVFKVIVSLPLVYTSYANVYLIGPEVPGIDTVPEVPGIDTVPAAPAGHCFFFKSVLFVVV
jgi:hypothetical protein